jgi:diguanylate cyclase (GGDEF)-like protein
MAANISLLSELLRQDYKIKVAKNGAKALEIARGVEKPDLILLDIEMPEMDGYEVCKILKNDNQTKNIPIIFVTARSDVADEAYGLNLGAVDYISKPFHPDIIKIRVKNHVALKLKSDWLEDLSMVDGLTHIPNRRYFDDLFMKVHKETLRDAKNIAVMMIDVDYFKPYNDHYGHGKGDDCLIKVAAALSSTLKRPADLVARYGGEEFVVLLENIDYAGAIVTGENLRRAIDQLHLPHQFSSVTDHVTISIGLAFKDGYIKEENRDALLKCADDALYQAKALGRNRVIACTDFMP